MSILLIFLSEHTEKPKDEKKNLDHCQIDHIFCTTALEFYPELPYEKQTVSA